MKHTPTPEQAAIITEAVHTTSNLIIEARAGAAKTTTLEMVAHQFSSATSILYLAFNKSVAKEAEEKLPSWCTAKTLNSLGHRAWAKQIGKHLSVSDKKSRDSARHHITSSFTADERNLLNENFIDLIRTCTFAKQCGYVPDKTAEKYKTCRPLCDDESFFSERSPYHLEPEEQHLVKLILDESISEALSGFIDYDDQIYMPTIFPCSFEHYKIVMIDEAQDLSSINHAMLAKVAKRSRLIAVGDPCQAIYGFRGAHQDSMELLAKQFDMKRLYLTTSFRCPTSVVLAAQSRAPDMVAPDWAKEGEVAPLDEWTTDTIPDDAVVICRNNAPLFSLAIALIRGGRSPEVIGRDVLRNLYNKMRKLGKPEIRQKQLIVEIQNWLRKELRRNRDDNIARDIAAAMMIFASQSVNLGEALLSIDALTVRKGRIKLMTGHKAKGLEFDHVFFLDQDLCNWNRGQDHNIWYVIVTRSMNKLNFVQLENITLL